MLNYWWFKNPKRKLNSIPEILAAFAETEMQEKWFIERETHYYLDDALEYCGLKREGEERNKPIGVGSAYKAWLESLGLLFVQRGTNKWKFTLAGKAILNGESPIKILTNQILKYQFPSAFSLKANVSERFKVHPFWLLLKLLANRSIEYLTQDEIAKVVITEAENETDRCYRKLTSRIMSYRFYGDRSLDKDFAEKYLLPKVM